MSEPTEDELWDYVERLQANWQQWEREMCDNPAHDGYRAGKCPRCSGVAQETQQ